MVNNEHYALLKGNIKGWNEWRHKHPSITIDLKDAFLAWEDLRGANLSKANIIHANLSNAKLNNANLSGANLSGAILSGAILSEANLSGAILSRTNITAADLSGANLTGLDLSGVNLTRANLSKANLTKTQALGTDFTGAKFTGACLEDWNINSATKLNDIVCEYFYFKSDKQERHPNSKESFAPGEFTKLFQNALNTIDLTFRNGVDWEAFAYSFRKIQVENAGEELVIQSIKIDNDGVLVVGVKVSHSFVDKVKIRSNFFESYDLSYKLLEEKYRGEVSGKDRQIVHYRKEVQRQYQYINQLVDLLNEQQRVQKAMAENPGKISNNTFHNPQFAGGYVDSNIVNAHQIGGNITNYAPEQRNLAEAAAEIQKLLNQLEQTNPTATETEKIAYVNDETTPSLKRRCVEALQAGGETAIDEFILDNKYLKVAKAVIKGWLEA